MFCFLALPLALHFVPQTCSVVFADVSYCYVQAQKELLDAELDLYKKSQAGEDTAMLKIKYTQLQIEVITWSWKRKQFKFK